MAGAFFAGAAAADGIVDSHAMGWLDSTTGDVEVHVPAKPRADGWGTGERREGLAKRVWRVSASRSARSRASSAWEGCRRSMAWSSMDPPPPLRSASCWRASSVTASSSSAGDRRGASQYRSEGPGSERSHAGAEGEAGGGAP